MIIVLSGEGKSDLGQSRNGIEVSKDDDFEAGPMTFLIDQITFQEIQFSPMESRAFRYISETSISQRAKTIRNPRSPLLGRTLSRPPGSSYFRRNTQILGIIAREISESESDPDVIAVFFRDSDGTNTSDDWKLKRESILNGFQLAEFRSGVAMIPRPKSEAWILCALREPCYSNCEQLESESGNDASPRSLKKQLEDCLGKRPSASEISELIKENRIVASRINMPSFNLFRDDFVTALSRS